MLVTLGEGICFQICLQPLIQERRADQGTGTSTVGPIPKGTPINLVANLDPDFQTERFSTPSQENRATL